MGAKQVLLEQLKVQWYPLVNKDVDIDKSMVEVMKGIKNSGFALAFKAMGVGEADIRKVLEELKSEKRG